MIRVANWTAADKRFAAALDQGLPRREIRAALDLTSSQFDGRRRRLLRLREMAA